MIKVIIVDDEPLSRQVLEYQLNKIKYPISIVGEASNGDEAIRLIREKNPDLVFMDVEMPRFNGLDVIKMINLDNDIDTEFIIITAYGNFSYAQEALRLGVKDIILKPIDGNSLLNGINRALDFNLTDNQLLNEIIAYLGKNYNKQIRLDELSLRFHTSENNINQLLKKYFDMTLISYVNKIRIDKSICLMNADHLNAKEVYTDVGFNNLNYFYKVFKNITGKTPKEYFEKWKDLLNITSNNYYLFYIIITGFLNLYLIILIDILLTFIKILKSENKGSIIFTYMVKLRYIQIFGKLIER